MFYIARARINAVEGASAEIGMSVWMVLAAWILTALAGCASSCGLCCARDNRRGQEEGRRKRDYEEVNSNAGHGNGGYGYPPQKRQGPPIREEEVSVPLNGKREDSPEPKYLEDEEDRSKVGNGRPGMNAQNSGQGSAYAVPGAAGGVVPGVGYGYNPRGGQDVSNGHIGYPPQPQGQYADPYGSNEPQYPGSYPQNQDRSITPATYAGSFVGIGAGGREREVPPAVPALPGHGMGATGAGGAVSGAPGYVPGGQGYGGYHDNRRGSENEDGYGYGQRDACE